MTLLTLTLNGLIMNFIKNFIAEEDGITAIEYALMAALIAAAIAAGLATFSTAFQGAFTKLAAKINPA